MRNDKQIRKLKACISALEAKRKAALEAAGSIEDDDEWDAESMRIHTELSPLTLAIECGWLEYPEPRSDWFKNFVSSFGLCESRRISEKQMEIFRRYCEEEHDPAPAHCTTSYKCRLGNLRIEATYHRRGSWVTITETPVAEIERLISLC